MKNSTKTSRPRRLECTACVQDDSAGHHREAAGFGLFTSERPDASTRRILTSWQDDRGESGRPVIIVVANLDDVAEARCEYLPVWPGCPFSIDLSDPESINITSDLESFRGHYEK